MKAILPACFIALNMLMATAPACLNVSHPKGVTLDGKSTSTGKAGHPYSRMELMGGLDRILDEKQWQSRLVELEQKMAGQPTLRDRSDYGGVLAYLRQFEKAREVLEAAEKDAPGDYAIAANLGTVYELLGENAKALEWIKKGIERNPDSHQGTEWVHVKILEAKLALAADPKWLDSHSVLGADYGADPRPVLKAPNARAENRRIITGAGYQLRERLQFVDAPNPLVGDLLFDLANALAAGGMVETAYGIYDLAKEYQAPRAPLLQQRFEFMEEVLRKAGDKHPKYLRSGSLR